MLTLFYAPGACSMAPHIVLEESGEKYEPKRMDLAMFNWTPPSSVEILSSVTSSAEPIAVVPVTVRFTWYAMASGRPTLFKSPATKGISFAESVKDLAISVTGSSAF